MDGKRGEAVGHQEIAGGGRRGQHRQPAAGRHADRGGQPDRRRGGEPAHQVPLDEDQAAADETDAGDDLRGHPGRVEHHVVAQHVGEPVLGHEHDQRRAEPDQRVRPQAGALLLVLTFKADQRGEHQRDGQLDDLLPPLAGGFGEQHPRPFPSDMSAYASYLPAGSFGPGGRPPPASDDSARSGSSIAAPARTK